MRSLTIIYCQIAAMLTLLSVAGVATAGDLPTHRFIHASGEVVRSYAANVGEVNFELTELNPVPESCLESLLKDSDEVMAYLQELGVASEDIYATQIKRYISPVEYLDTPENQKKYRLIRSFQVVVRDLEKWDTLIKYLTRKPYLGNFTVNFGRNDLASLQSEMLAQAIEEAKVQAKNIATSLAVKLDMVTGVSQSPLTSMSSALGLTGVAPIRDQGPKPTIVNRDLSVPAQLRFSMQVNLMYRIK